MNAFDSSILTFLNQFAHRWYPLDGAMYYAATYNLVKGGVIAAALWWIWFDRHQEQPRKQEILVSTLAADRKSTRLNSSHSQISYAVFCLKKKKNRSAN